MDKDGKSDGKFILVFRAHRNNSNGYTHVSRLTSMKIPFMSLSVAVTQQIHVDMKAGKWKQLYLELHGRQITKFIAHFHIFEHPLYAVNSKSKCPNRCLMPKIEIWRGDCSKIYPSPENMGIAVEILSRWHRTRDTLRGNLPPPNFKYNCNMRVNHNKQAFMAIRSQQGNADQLLA